MESVVVPAIEISLRFGKTLLKSGQQQKAYSIFTECLKISQSTGHPTIFAASLGCLGMFFMPNDVARGVSYYENALEILNNFESEEGSTGARKGNPKLRRRNQEIMAEAYALIGSAKSQQRSFGESIRCFQKCLDICEDLGDTHFKIKTYGNMGAVYRNLGQIRQAIECFEKELHFARETGEMDLEFHAHTNLGLCYRDVGEYPLALNCYEKSLDVVMATGRRQDECGTYANLSNVYRYLGNARKALEYAKKSLELSKVLGDLRGQFVASGGMGNAYCALGDYQTGSTCFQENANLARKIGDKALIARAEHSLGLASRFSEDYRKALTHHRTAERLFKESGMRLPTYHAMLGSANCLRVLQEYKAAGSIYQECINDYEELRSYLGNQENLKVSIGDLHVIVYKALAYTMLRDDEGRDALLVEDRGRAVALKDLLYHKFAVKSVYKLIKEQGTEDAKRVSRFVDKLREDDELTTLFYSFFNGQMCIWVVSNSCVDWVRPWGEKETEKYLALMNLVDMSLTQIREGLRGEVEDREISASEADDYDDVFAVHESASVPWSHPVKHSGNFKDFEVDSSRKFVPKSSLKTKLSDVSDQGNPLRQLYNILIKPVEHLIRGNKLLIIPEAALYRLPFSALLDGEGLFLCKKYSVQMCTSLETLAIISERPKQVYQGGALVIGNPLVGRVCRRGEEVNPCGLPGAQREAELVGSLLNTAPLIQRMATKSAVMKRLSKVSVVHIAAHGDPVKGEIVLAPDPDPARNNCLPTEEEYMLTCADIASLSMCARLVVLSCCQTAQGDIRAEGVVGIARSFLGAGARAVVVSLWAIDDEATLSFMELFYNHLAKQGLSVCQALQRSMLTLQGREEFKRISDWAPFYVIGEDVKFSDEEMEQWRNKAAPGNKN